MSAPAIRVSREWLALREPADAAARAEDLVAYLATRAPARRCWIIHDLAGGAGAMGRWLAPLLPGPQRWVVHDLDADLLDAAIAHPPGPAADGAAVALEARHSDITRLQPSDLADATLITASAVLDLLTEEELVRVIASCVRQSCPVLLTLSVVGQVEMSPPDRLDRVLAAAFDAHQRRTTERGRLLGPDAVPLAIRELCRLGSEVLVRSSPWRLGPAQAELAAEWLSGWVAAACEQEVELAAHAGPYTDLRLAQAAAGGLTATVGHVDVLALPRPRSAGVPRRPSCATETRQQKGMCDDHQNRKPHHNRERGC